jgi:tRNA dimethylallyltransferase
MKIGTAVPDAKELAAARHHFIQNKSIFATYTVGDFEKEAIAKLDELFSKNNIQIAVGGSGLYVNALLQGLDDFPEISIEIRENVRKQYEINGLVFLQKKLEELDNPYYSTLLKENPQTLQNPQRMMRFVEVCIASKKPYSSFLNQKKNVRNFIPIVIGLEADREIMYNRINERVDCMLQEGLLEEATNLYPNKDLNALQTVGYRELFYYID